jgi:LmbE family N-acetylglucosaminyl deacetylase
MLADHELDRALVIVAHPDDTEFWAGARSPAGLTLALP